MFLGQKSVATILIGAHQGLIGAQMSTPVDATYLADAVILLRYFENKGEVRQAISVMKKRGSRHERTLRDFRLDSGRITVGAPLREFSGVLTGVPRYRGPRRAPARRRGRVTASSRNTTAGCCSWPQQARDAATTEALLSPLGIRSERLSNVRRAACRGSGKALAPSWCPRRRRRPQTMPRWGMLLAIAAAMVGSSHPDTDAAGRRFLRVGRGSPDAGQRDAAGAPAPGIHVDDRRAHGAPGA